MTEYTSGIEILKMQVKLLLFFKAGPNSEISEVNVTASIVGTSPQIYKYETFVDTASDHRDAGYPTEITPFVCELQGTVFGVFEGISFSLS